MIKSVKIFFGLVDFKDPHAKINKKGTIAAIALAIIFFSTDLIFFNQLSTLAHYCLNAGALLSFLVFTSRILQHIKLKNEPIPLPQCTQPNETVVSLAGEFYASFVTALKTDTPTIPDTELGNSRFLTHSGNAFLFAFGAKSNLRRQFCLCLKNTNTFIHPRRQYPLIVLDLYQSPQKKQTISRFNKKIDLNTRLALAQLEELFSESFSKINVSLQDIQNKWPSRQAFENDLKKSYKLPIYLLGYSLTNN